MLKRFINKDKLKGFYSKDYNVLPKVMKESFLKIVNEHLDDRLKLIENKTLIIFGKEDKETPIYMAKKFHKNLKDSELYLVEGAGHFCFIDKENEFNFVVKEFLSKKKGG